MTDDATQSLSGAIGWIGAIAAATLTVLTLLPLVRAPIIASAGSPGERVRLVRLVDKFTTIAFLTLITCIVGACLAIVGLIFPCYKWLYYTALLLLAFATLAFTILCATLHRLYSQWSIGQQ